jgi:NAD(P)-dependent dehydrogenase (short-subunit alcohol dehydrogenase family)
MAKGDGGSIINISSTASLRPTPDELPYAAAKAGLIVLTSGFAQALGPVVRVNGIVAGPFLTDISAAWDMVAFEEAAQRYPLQRAGRPEEVVGAALYFASDASSYATGATLVLDGGQSLGRA